MRMRKKPNLIPRMEACAGLWVREPESMRGRWRSLMPEAKRLRLELGCGKGRFTAETAARHPEDLYVALERVPDAMVTAMERCRARGLTNVFFIDGDAAELERYFAPDEVDLLYIDFCAPWPAVTHAKRRLTRGDFVRRYRLVLRDGGEVRFKTDNRPLFEWSLFQFPKAGFALSQVTRDLHANGPQGVMTDYEEKFHRMGTPINRCVGTKGPLTDLPLAEGLRRTLEGWTVEELPADGGTALPPRAKAEQLRTLRLRRNGEEAGLQVLEGYPRERTAWLLTLAAGEEDRAALAEALCAAVRLGGFTALRLRCPLAEEETHRFWLEQGFADLRPAEDGGAPAVVMERLV